MSKFSRDIILLVRDESLPQQKIEIAVQNLHEIIANVETLEVFCQVHELVARNRITRKKFKIIDAISSRSLKPFYFLINKN